MLYGILNFISAMVFMLMLLCLTLHRLESEDRTHIVSRVRFCRKVFLMNITNYISVLSMIAFQSHANHLLPDSMGYIIFEVM